MKMWALRAPRRFGLVGKTVLGFEKGGSGRKAKKRLELLFCRKKMQRRLRNSWADKDPDSHSCPQRKLWHAGDSFAHPSETFKLTCQVALRTLTGAFGFVPLMGIGALDLSAGLKNQNWC